MGWFGPRGLATVVFTIMLIDEEILNGEIIAAIAVFGIVMSVFAHGLSSPPLVSAYSAWWEGLSEDERVRAEGQQVYEHRVRHSTSEVG